MLTGGALHTTVEYAAVVSAPVPPPPGRVVRPGARPDNSYPYPGVWVVSPVSGWYNGGRTQKHPETPGETGKEKKLSEWKKLAEQGREIVWVNPLPEEIVPDGEFWELIEHAEKSGVDENDVFVTNIDSIFDDEVWVEIMPTDRAVF